MSNSARFLFKPVGWDLDRKIIESIKRFHRAEKPIYAYNIGLDCGLDPSIVSRWFRDHGIFWDCWRKEWLVIVPEMLGDEIAAKLPEGSIKPANWILSSFWLNSGATGAAR